MATKRFTTTLLLLSGLEASPGLAADAASGQRIATRWCAACHMISPDQKGANTETPSFASVAARYNSRDLAAFLASPYPRMPNMALSQPEIADLVAYIRMLGPRRDEPTPMEKDDKPPEPRRG